jgi:hypothetical protein
MNWLARIFGKHEEPSPFSSEKPALVMSGIYLSGRNWFLCRPDNEEIRGVKIVTVPRELYNRYVGAEIAWLGVQGELASLPKSLQPRRRSTRKAKEPEGVAVEG